MKENIIKIILGSIGGFISYHLGGWDTTLGIFALFAILDYTTGVLRASYEGKLNSKTGFKGIIKKLMYFVVIAVAAALDRLLGQDNMLRAVTIMFFIGNEGLSILENYAACDLPLPPGVKEKLEQLKGDKV